MGKKKPTARDNEDPATVPVVGSKSKKKAVVIDDDEYSIGTELSEESQAQEDKVATTGKKKGKKGNQKTKDEDEEKAVNNDDHEVRFSSKNSKGKKGGGAGVFSSANLGMLEDNNNDDDERSELTGENDCEEEGESVIASKGMKKGSKKGGGMFTASAFSAFGDDGEVVDKEDEEDEEDVTAITFTGKKKSSKSTKKNDHKFSTLLHDEADDEEASVSESVKPSDNIVEGESEDGSVIAFTGKKKSSKKKGTSSSVFVALGDEGGSEASKSLEAQQPLSVAANDIKVTKTEETSETSKNKKKKKNSERTAQEEDELDKILAELGGGPPAVKPSALPPQEEKLQAQPEPVSLVDAVVEKEGEEESAAAKKKKKKKEKEKEKKAAAAAAASAVKEEIKEELKAEAIEPKKTDTKGKAAEKKVPKHVREMQEAIARRKEYEERKAKEEEEKRKKEEEERLRQEELERQAEEARRRKKEREKEKFLKKKQEGKLLTGKQKEEQRRLEAMRNQILANANVSIPTADKEGAPSKRPKYQTKKKPANHNANGAAMVRSEEIVEAKEQDQQQEEVTNEVESMELEKDEEVESVHVEEKPETAVGVDENGLEEDDDEEWDAKSWDDVNLNVKGAFDDEEVDSEPEGARVKERKSAKPVSQSTTRPADSKPSTEVKTAVTSHTRKAQEVENKSSQLEVKSADKNKKKDAVAKSTALVSDNTTKEQGEELRSPICCIMGHVDTGKTKLLDCIRGTNVQEGEAGGITQQIGATYFPAENIRERTKELKADATLKVPGLLVIDTPGHESFTNLRSRGSGLCDIAILVVDIMHGLEPQTKESINLLTMRNTEFIVALNKVDRLYGWKPCRNAPIWKALKQQSKDVQSEFDRRLKEIKTQFMEQGLNTELYYKNKEMKENYNIVPTSAISGEGIPDLLLLLVQWTQKTMVEKLTFINEVQCTVLEVKVIEGHGTTIDVVLVNGVLHEGDQIVVCGMQGPIVTTIRALLTPHPMKELRIKGQYIHHKEIKAAQGIKITGQGFEHAIAGTGLYVVRHGDDLDDVIEAAQADMKSVMNRIDKSGEGVYVQASTLGSLEALLEFLKSPAVNIPVSGIGIGPVHKKDVMKASVMLEKKKEYATILAFDVKVTPEARDLADELGVTIFIADIIYHLFDQFKAYIDNLKEEKKKEAADEAVFPCVLEIVPHCIFNKKDPIVLGVTVLEGTLKIGTPICVPQKDFIDIGRIASIENNKKPVDIAKRGQMVAIKIIGTNPEEQQRMHGRHFESDDQLVSRISRRSIDVLKANYRDELPLEEWRLVAKLKTLFKIT